VIAVNVKGWVALPIVLSLLLTVTVAVLPTSAGSNFNVTKEWVTDTGPGITYYVDLTADGSKAVVAIEYPPRVDVIDVSSGKVIKEISGFSGYYVSAAAVSPSSDKVAILLSRNAGGNKYFFKVVLTSLSTGKKIWSSKEYPGFGWNLDFTDDGKLIIASPGNDNTVYAFNALSGALAWKHSISKVDDVIGVKAYGSRIYVGAASEGTKGYLIVLNNAGREVTRVSGLPGRPLTPALSPNGKLLAVPVGLPESQSVFKGWVILYDTTTMKRIWTSPNLGEYPWTAAFLPSLNTVVTVLDDGKVCFLSMKDGLPIKCERNEGWFGDFVVTIPSKGLAIVALDKKVSSNKHVGRVIAYRATPLTTTTKAEEGVTKVKFIEPTVKWVKAQTVWVNKGFKDNNVYEDKVAISPDGKYVAVISHYKSSTGRDQVTINVLRMKDGGLHWKYTHIAKEKETFVHPMIEWSPNGKILYIAIVELLPTTASGGKPWGNNELVSVDMAAKNVLWVKKGIRITRMAAVGPNRLILLTISNDNKAYYVQVLNGLTGESLLTKKVSKNPKVAAYALGGITTNPPFAVIGFGSGLASDYRNSTIVKLTLDEKGIVRWRVRIEGFITGITPLPEGKRIVLRLRGKVQQTPTTLMVLLNNADGKPVYGIRGNDLLKYAMMSKYVLNEEGSTVVFYGSVYVCRLNVNTASGTCAKTEGLGSIISASPAPGGAVIAVISGGYEKVAYVKIGSETATTPATSPHTSQPVTTPKTTPRTSAGTSPKTSVVTHVTTHPRNPGFPWTLVGAGGAGAFIVVVLLVLIARRRSRKEASYPPPPPPP